MAKKPESNPAVDEIADNALKIKSVLDAISPPQPATAASGNFAGTITTPADYPITIGNPDMKKAIADIPKDANISDLVTVKIDVQRQRPALCRMVIYANGTARYAAVIAHVVDADREIVNLGLWNVFGDRMSACNVARIDTPKDGERALGWYWPPRV